MFVDAVSGRLGDNWWKDNLRMSQDTFHILCNELRSYIQKELTNMRSPVTVEERVAVTVWKLATNIEYRTLASLFGLGRSTVGKIVLETCNIMTTKLLARYVHLPEGTRLREIVDGFEVCWGFPQVAGAIDGTHVPVIKPQDNPSDYYNRKGFYSIIMQAVVDYRGLFLDTYIGWPGKVHDARVFSENAFGRLKGRWRCMLKRMDFVLENVPSVVAACVILHNFCEMYGDHFQSEWEVNEHTEGEMDTSHTSTGSQTASDIRAALTQYLFNN